MSVKYKPSIIWIIMAILWTAITVYIYQRYIPSTDPEYLLVRIITIVILPALIALYYLTMPLISYCKLTEKKISIHKSAIIFRNTIKREDLECCRIHRRDLEFYHKNGKNYAMHLDWSNKEQTIELIKKLQSFTNVYEGNSQRIIDLKDIDTLS